MTDDLSSIHIINITVNNNNNLSIKVVAMSQAQPLASTPHTWFMESSQLPSKVGILALIV